MDSFYLSKSFFSQVELLITYEGSMFSASEKRFLLDTFTRGEFTGTWRKLFDEITKHVLWSICKSLFGAQVGCT